MRDAALATQAEAFVVADGTALARVDLQGVLEAHRKKAADLTMVVCETRGRSVRSLAPAGIYVASRGIMDLVPPKGYQDIKEMLIPALYREGRCVMPYVVPGGSIVQVTGTGSYLAANDAIAEHFVPHDLWSSYRTVGNARVHASARVAPTACMVGPVLVGPGCVVEEGATIVGPTTIGADSRIERDAVIRRAAVWSSCHIGSGAILDNCILVDGAVIERGAVARDAVCGIDAAERGASWNQARTYWGVRGAASELAGKSGTAGGRSWQVSLIHS